MKAITFDRFDVGIDLRKGDSVTDANRMRDLLNCDVTTGFAIRKRAGLRKVVDLPDESIGLFALGANLNVVTKDSIGADSQPTEVFSQTVIAGYLYMSIKLEGVARHYYFDAAAQIPDIPADLLKAFNTARSNLASVFPTDSLYPSLDYLAAKKAIDAGELAAAIDQVKIVAVDVQQYAKLLDVDDADDVFAQNCSILIDKINIVIDQRKLDAVILFDTPVDLLESDLSIVNGDYATYIDGYDLYFKTILNGSLSELANTVVQRFVHNVPNYYSEWVKAIGDVIDVVGNFYTLQATQIMDVNCPNSRQIVSIAGKVFAPSKDGASVRFSATNKPRDWTTADDAGFLPISHHGGGLVTALAVYRGMLAVFTDSAIQIWKVDPDPAQHALVDITHGVGTQYPYSITSISGDVLFLAYSGIRSLSQQSSSGNLSDLDIGSPVDALMSDLIKRNANQTIRGHYSQSLGKFLLFVGKEVLVYSFSKTSKLAAWSRWELPDVVTGAAELMGKTYLRLGNQLVVLDADCYTDMGINFPVKIVMGAMIFKAPGSLKRLAAMDAVVQGSADLRLGIFENNAEEEVELFELTGDSRPWGTLPVGLHGTAFSPRIYAEHDNEMQLDLLTFYWDSMGVR